MTPPEPAAVLAPSPDQARRREHHAAQERKGQVHWTDSRSWAGERARQILLLLVLAAVLVYGLLKVTLVVIPVLLALILAAATTPLVRWLRHRGWRETPATTATFLALIAVFAGVVAGVVLTIRSEWSTLAERASRRFDELVGVLQDGPLPVDEASLENLGTAARDFATSSAAGGRATDSLFVATELLTGFILMAVVLFFLLKDGHRIWAFCLIPFRVRQRAKMRLAGMSGIDVLGGYVRGTAIVALVDAVLIGAALFVLQVPLAAPLAVVVFVGAFIPLIGATAAGVLAAVVALVANGPVVALVVAAVVVLVNQLEGNLLQPVVMGKTLSVHPLVILLALTAGTVLAGIIGAILSVPLTAVAWAIAKIWIGDRFEARAAAAGADG